MRRFAISVFVGVMLLGAAPLGSAHPLQWKDPNDAPGPLDIRELHLDHGNRKIVVTLKMQERWSKRLLRPRIADLFFIFETGRGDNRLVDYDVRVLYRERKDKLVARLRWAGMRTGVIKRVTVDKQGKSVTVKVPRRLIQRGKDVVRWGGTTRVYTGKRRCKNPPNPDVGCVDRAPSDYPHIWYWHKFD